MGMYHNDRDRPRRRFGERRPQVAVAQPQGLTVT